MALSGLLPLLLLEFHDQVHPLVGQFPKTFVVGDFLSHLGEAFGTHETCPALAAPGETELVIRSVLSRFLGVFAAAARLAADVVLLAQAARMYRPELGELLLQMRDLAFDLSGFHIRYHYNAIGYCRALSLKISKLSWIFPLSPCQSNPAAGIRDTIPPCR